MSLAATLHAWLALVPAKVLGEDTKLEVVIWNGQLQVNEAKVPQKVSLDLNKWTVSFHNSQKYLTIM